MTPEMVIVIGKKAISTAGLIALPVLVVALLVGLIVSILQAITQIHEMTLTFIPKILAIGITLYFLLPWMLKIIIGYTLTLYQIQPLG